MLSSCSTASSLLLLATLANLRAQRIQPTSCRPFPRSLSNLFVPASNFSSKGVKAVTGDPFVIGTCPSMRAPFWDVCVNGNKCDVLAEAVYQFRPKHSSAGRFCIFSSLCSNPYVTCIETMHMVFSWYLRGTKQERAAERDEQWEAQQNVLKRRRGNLWQDVSPQLHHLTNQPNFSSTHNCKAMQAAFLHG